MKVTQEKLPASQIGLEIEITSNDQAELREGDSKPCTHCQYSWVSQGKVPRQILLQRLGNLRLKATALEELIKMAEALKQSENDCSTPATLLF